MYAQSIFLSINVFAVMVLFACLTATNRSWTYQAFFFHSTLSSITNDALKIHFQIWTVRSMWNKCSIGTVVFFFFFRQLEASHWIFGGKRSIDTVAAWKKTNKIREIDENPCKLSITTSTKYSSSRRQRH